jgi:hypothetical protein
MWERNLKEQSESDEQWGTDPFAKMEVGDNRTAQTPFGKYSIEGVDRIHNPASNVGAVVYTEDGDVFLVSTADGITSIQNANGKKLFPMDTTPPEVMGHHTRIQQTKYLAKIGEKMNFYIERKATPENPNVETPVRMHSTGRVVKIQQWQKFED